MCNRFTAGMAGVTLVTLALLLADLRFGAEAAAPTRHAQSPSAGAAEGGGPQ